MKDSKPRLVWLDDDPLVHRAFTRHLRTLAEVCTANTPAQAQALLEEAPTALLLTDSIGGPHISGWCAAHPGLRVVVISGGDAPSPLPKEVRAWLPKPIEPAALLGVVANQLENKMKRPPTGPQLRIATNAPQPSPTPPGKVAINSSGDDFSTIIEAVLREKGIIKPQSPAELAAIVALANKVPRWVIYLALAFGAPLLGFLVTTYQTASQIPKRIEALETASQKQGAVLEEILKRLPTSPSTRP